MGRQIAFVLMIAVGGYSWGSGTLTCQTVREALPVRPGTVSRAGVALDGGWDKGAVPDAFRDLRPKRKEA